jgi:hypothetical protein
VPAIHALHPANYFALFLHPANIIFSYPPRNVTRAKFNRTSHARLKRLTTNKTKSIFMSSLFEARGQSGVWPGLKRLASGIFL